MATQTSLLPSSHSDLITSLSFSHHGTQLATSSLDHTIRVTSLSPTTGQWDHNTVEFKAHDSSVLKVVWGHPEFGKLLASGGVDGVVKIWSEVDGTTVGASSGGQGRTFASNANGSGQQATNTLNTPAKSIKKWIQRAALTDCRGTVRDLEFCPPEFGLKLACISSDSHLRLWECLDPIAFKDWNLIEDIDLGLLSGTMGSSTGAFSGAGIGRTGSSGSLGGNGPKGFETGSPSKAGGGVTSTGAFSSTAGAGGLASTSLGSMSNSTSSAGGIEGRKSGTVESDGGWSLSWCKEAWWGERLAVTSGASGIIRLFHLPDHAPWTNFLNLLPPRPTSSFSQPAPVSSLCWAPASGRSYQLLASGSRDGRARIWKLYPPSLSEDVTGASREEWSGEMDAELEDGNRGASSGGSVGNVKVDWNLTGTVVSTAGDDAKVRLWKSTYTGQWKAIALLSTEDTEDNMQS